MLTFFFLLRLAAGIPFLGIKNLKILTLLVTFIILMQTIFGPGTTYIVNPLFPPSFPVLGGMGSLKWEGFFLGLTIVCRFLSLMILLPVFTVTTPPHKIAEGLCAMKVNYRYAFIISTAFNMIPVFRDEALIIMDAQKLRGLQYFDKRPDGKKTKARRSIFYGIKLYSSLLIPLILSAMRKAQYASVAMESRGFGLHKTRTWLKKPQIAKHDIFCFFASVFIFISVLFVNYQQIWKLFN